LLRGRRQLVQGVVALLVLQDELEAAHAAHAADGGRLEGQHPRAGVVATTRMLRQPCRKMKMTKMTSAMASTSVNSTSLMDSSTAAVVSKARS